MGEQVASISVLQEPPVADKVPDHYVVDYTVNRVQVEMKTKAGGTEAPGRSISSSKRSTGPISARSRPWSTR